jgi:hypothetical protein
MLGVYGGFWDYWSLYHKVTFDGDNRIVIVNPGILELSVKDDVYSSWKEWIKLEDYSKYEPAMRVVGGDPTVGGRFLGATFFLINGWKIRTWEGNHRLVITGNLYSDDGQDAFLDTLGKHKITINQNVSNLVDLMEGGSGGGSSGAGLTQAERDRLFATAQESTVTAIKNTVNTTASNVNTVNANISASEGRIQANIDAAELAIDASIEATKDAIYSSRDTINTNLGSVETNINTRLDNLQTGGGLTPEQQDMLVAVFRVLGLDPTRPLIVSRTERTAGPEVEQDISEVNGTVTVTRRP